MSFASLSANSNQPGEAESKRVTAGAETGGGHRAPASISSKLRRGCAAIWQRVVQSVWLPVFFKLGGIGLAMLVLAAIGTISTLRSEPGVAIAKSNLLGGTMSGSWLSPGSGPEKPFTQNSAPPKPSERDAPAPRARCDEDAGAVKSSGLTADGKVILNTAGIDDLMRLPGVGRRRAQAIVELRARLKRFRRPTDLLRVKGIGVRSLKRMLPHLVVDPPSDKKTDAGP